LSLKGEKCFGGKKSKERVTALVGANMDGTEKLPLLVIGKYAKPRCFKNVKILPCSYTNNAKAWMTGKIFLDWLEKLDKKFYQQKRKVLLLLDNCTAHCLPTNLESIEIKFLPANTTSLLQPCDGGIIKNLKIKYKKRLVNKIIRNLDENKDTKIDLLQALEWLQTAWLSVSRATIQNCFGHCGFIVDPSTATEISDQNELDFEQEMLDSEVEVCEKLSLDDIITMVMDKDKHSEEEDQDEEENAAAPPTVSSIMDCLDHLKRGIFSFNFSEEQVETLYSNIATLENTFLSKRPMTKKNLQDYFK
jgi:hypothetical protein